MGLGNSYFQFKQFTVHQGDCAMKVTTDACIQGAWTPVQKDEVRILDIGAGTGLLSLMLAQKAPNAIVDAVELNEQAATQAGQNFAGSPWADRLNVICSDIQGYRATHKYDLIISNPPFFNNSLKGPEASRNNARHTTALT
jgi:tRNA1Val (adenine37-N6)-methyltransferase